MKQDFVLVILVVALVLGGQFPILGAENDSLVVTDAGNVGIGTNAPVTNLEVRGVGLISNSDDSQKIQLGYRPDSVLDLLYSVPKRGLSIHAMGEGNQHPLIDAWNYDGTNWIQRLSLSSDGNMYISGNVGIGTTTPGYKLDVKGWLRVSGSGPSGDPAARIGVYDTDNTGNIGGWWFSQNSDGKLAIHQHAVADRLVIDGSGNIGIGTSSPLEKLHVNGSMLVDQWIKINESGTFYSSGRMHIHGEEILYLLNKGGVIIGKEWGGNGNLTVQGLINGTVSGDSDERLKENIETIDNALEKIAQIRGVSYNWIDASRGDGPQIGVIAQEVEEIFPEVVHTDNQGYKSVEYAKLVAPLIEAVKSLKQENENLKNRIAEIEAKLIEHQ